VNRSCLRVAATLRAKSNRRNRLSNRRIGFLGDLSFENVMSAYMHLLDSIGGGEYQLNYALTYKHDTNYH
jgi:hypothetical protein